MEGITDRRRWGIYFILVVILLSQSIYGEWMDRFAEHETVYLSELKQNPVAYRDIPVFIPLRYCKMGSTFASFFTEFDEDAYINFSAWDIRTHIWQKEGFLDSYAHFYIEKRNPELRTFQNLKTFDTICVLGKVTGIFRDKPYIKVVWVKRLPGKLNIYNLKLLYKASTAFANRDFEGARKLFRNILRSLPPRDIAAMIYKSIAKIHMWDSKNYKKAIKYFEKAQELVPNDAEALALEKGCRHYLQYGGPQPLPGDWVEPLPVKPKPEEENKEASTQNTETSVSEVPAVEDEKIDDIDDIDEIDEIDDIDEIDEIDEIQ